MNAFVNAANAPRATVTTNGMNAVTGSGSATVDLFYDINPGR